MELRFRGSFFLRIFSLPTAPMLQNFMRKQTSIWKNKKIGAMFIPCKF